MAKNTGKVTDDTPAGKMGIDPRDPWYGEINRAAKAGGTNSSAVRAVMAKRSAGETAPGSTLSMADATKNAIDPANPRGRQTQEEWLGEWTDEILNRGAYNARDTLDEAGRRRKAAEAKAREQPGYTESFMPEGSQAMVEPKGTWTEAKKAELRKKAEAKRAAKWRQARRAGGRDPVKGD